MAKKQKTQKNEDKKMNIKVKDRLLYKLLSDRVRAKETFKFFKAVLNNVTKNCKKFLAIIEIFKNTRFYNLIPKSWLFEFVNKKFV